MEMLFCVPLSLIPSLKDWPLTSIPSQKTKQKLADFVHEPLGSLQCEQWPGLQPEAR